jgi:hypothetical protein
VKDKAKYSAGQQQQTVFFQQSPDLLTIRVNPKLITTAINAGYLTELAFYYFLRHHYKYLHISNEKGNPKRRIAQLSGLSQPTIDKYFRVLIQHNLLKTTVHGYELTATNPRYLRFKIKVTAAPTVSEIKQLLFSQVIHDAGKRQLLIKQIENYCLSAEDQDQKLTGTVTLFTSFAPSFSVRYLSSKLNISVNTVRSLIKDLNARRVIRTVSSDPRLLIAGVMPGDDKHAEGLHGYRYIKNGNLFGIEPSQHSFLMQPIIVREMTLTRYNRVKKDDKIRQLIWQTNRRLMN